MFSITRITRIVVVRVRHRVRLLQEQTQVLPGSCFCIRSFQTTAARLQRKSKIALVVGSSGSLGLAVSKLLSRQEHMLVIGADVQEPSGSPPNDTFQLDDFVPLPHYGQYPTLADITERLAKGVDYCLTTGTSIHTAGTRDDDSQYDDGEDEQTDDSSSLRTLDAIIVASGGFQMDPTTTTTAHSHNQENEGARAYGESIETMMRMNYYPVAAAGYIAQEYMAPQGLFVVIGATAALSPTPGMIGYGVSKAAAHSYVQTLGATTGMAVSSKSLRKESRRARRRQATSGTDAAALDTMTVVGILPNMLDTPSNRATNPNVDFDACTKPLDIAQEIGTWVSTPPLRPHSGSLVKVFTNPGEGTKFHLVR